MVLPTLETAPGSPPVAARTRPGRLTRLDWRDQAIYNDGAVTMNELFPRGDRYSARYSPEPPRSKRPGLER